MGDKMKKIILFISIFLLVGCGASSSLKYEPNTDDILEKVAGEGYIEEMTIYGKYFNLKGVLKNTAPINGNISRKRTRMINIKYNI